jgi:hypothetical protein
VNAENNAVYLQLKALLVKNNCKVINEKQPESIMVKQGSLWGISPKTAKKTLRFQLLAAEAGTRIVAKSAFSSDYVKLTVAGCIFSVVLVFLCAWISLDLAIFAVSQNQTSWSWLVEAGGYTNLRGALLLSDLSRVFAVFLGVVLAIEGLIVVFAHNRIGCLAEEVLRTLSKA